MALAEKLHHSANRSVLPKKEEVEQHYAPRGTGASQGRARHAVLFCGRRERAGAGWGASGAGSGAAALHGGHGLRLPLRADTRSSCAADGGHSVGVLSSLGLASCRAGYRSTQGLLVIGRWSKCRRFCPVPCSSSGMRSKSLTFLVLEVVEVFQGVVQDQVRYSVLWSSTLTLQFLVVVIVKVFNVFLPDVVPDSVLWSRTPTFLPHRGRRTVEQNVDIPVPRTRTLGGLHPDVPHSVLWRRTSTFQFLALVPVVVFPQDRVCSAQ